mmetsp:Transcript_30178/g.46027  ORF Transcript_30178/g.46027 Transcript_30178/m.46027 type:complete len:220 (+) Transcript_30178:258-917(+)
MYTGNDFEHQASTLSKVLPYCKHIEIDSLVDWQFEPSQSTKPCQLVHPTIISEFLEGRKQITDFDDFHDSSILSDEDMIQPLSEKKTLSQKLEWRFSIVYSETWRAPILYFMVQDSSGHPCSREQVLLMLPSADVQDSWDFISYDEHPVTGRPSYFLHPCKTCDRLNELLRKQNTNLLLSWLSMVLPAVGFKLSSSTFLEVQRQALIHTLQKNKRMVSK